MLHLLIITRSRRSWRQKGKVLEFPEGPRVHSSKLICAHCTSAAETLKHFLSSYKTILKERGNNFEEVKWLFKLLVPHPSPKNRLDRWSITKKNTHRWCKTSQHQAGHRPVTMVGWLRDVMGWLRVCYRMVTGWLWDGCWVVVGGYRMVTGWLWGGYEVATRWPWGGFEGYYGVVSGVIKGWLQDDYGVVMGRLWGGYRVVNG